MRRRVFSDVSLPPGRRFTGQSYDTGDIDALRALVTESALSAQACPRQRAQRADSATLRTRRPECHYKLRDLDGTLVSKGLWKRKLAARHRRLNIERGEARGAGKSGRSLTLEDVETAVGATANWETKEWTTLCPACRNWVTEPVFRRCGHAFCCEGCVPPAAAECGGCLTPDFALFRRAADWTAADKSELQPSLWSRDDVGQWWFTHPDDADGVRVEHEADDVREPLTATAAWGGDSSGDGSVEHGALPGIIKRTLGSFRQRRALPGGVGSFRQRRGAVAVGVGLGRRKMALTAGAVVGFGGGGFLAQYADSAGK